VVAVIKLAIISPNPRIVDLLTDSLSGLAALDTILQLDQYPSADQTDHLAAAARGAILLLDYADFPQAQQLAATFDSSAHQITVIAVFADEPSKDHLMELMQVGIREVIAPPFRRSEICETVKRIAEKAGGNTAGFHNGEIHAFLPAKPGAGATTICCSVAAAIARLTNRRTLLLDFDMKLGVTSFLLKLDGSHSVADALAQSTRLDDDLWQKLVVERDKLEILGSAPTQANESFADGDYTAVLSHAQRIYATTCVDLPGNMDSHEIETLRRAARIYLVCTGDVTGLHVAQRKLALLNELQIPAAVWIVLNLTGRHGNLSAADIEHVLQTSVRFTLPCDEAGVSMSVQRGIPIMGRSALAIRIEEIAQKICSLPKPSAQPRPTSKFRDYLSISPVRSLLWQ
jgi:pilus assembly protein CpaE